MDGTVNVNVDSADLLSQVAQATMVTGDDSSKAVVIITSPQAANSTAAVQPLLEALESVSVDQLQPKTQIANATSVISTVTTPVVTTTAPTTTTAAAAATSITSNTTNTTTTTTITATTTTPSTSTGILPSFVFVNHKLMMKQQLNIEEARFQLQIMELVCVCLYTHTHTHTHTHTYIF